jgi:hypothetical protein
MKSVRFSSVVALSLAGCAVASSDEGLSSQSGFTSWGEATVRSCTIAKSREPTVNICLVGKVSQPDFERARIWSRRGLLTWLRVAKSLDDTVLGNLAFDCDARHITFNLRNGRGTSFATPGIVTVYMSRPYGTWSHEIGHAFTGLLDTYSSAAGSCREGQPQSLMCWGAYGPRSNPNVWSTLWADDIAGLTSNYRRLFGATLTPPAWAGTVDLERPIDIDAPWPGDASVVDRPNAHDVDIDSLGRATPIDAADVPGSIDL